MLRNAVLGLLVTGGLILAILFGVGFHPAQLLALMQPSYEDALAQGTWLAPMRVWGKRQALRDEYIIDMTVTNPTPRPLTLRGTWSTAPQYYEMMPANIDITVLPHQTKTVPVRMKIIATGKNNQPLRVTQFKPPVFMGEWQWQPWQRPGDPVPPLVVTIERTLEVSSRFGQTNYIVLGVYLLAMLGIGVWSGRRITDTRGFFIANGKMNYIVVGLSILGTYLSALTVMGLPGAAFGAHDWTYMVQLPCLVITAIVVTRFILPRYRAAGIISIYAFLEERIDVSARVVAAISFLFFSVGRMGLVLYLPALAFSTVTGAPLWMCVVGMGVIITAYTVIGGIEAVIWTDAIQVVIFIGGALVVLGSIFSEIDIATFVDIGVQHNKFRVLIPGFDIAKITTAWLVLETIFQTIRIYGTQQDVAQRYMATPSVEAANRSVWIAILAYIPLGFLFYFIGTALFVYYQVNVIDAPTNMKHIFPHFVVNQLPPGMAGLVIAAIFAAAMSSIDSCMNSSSTVCIEDFFKRFSKTKISEEHYLRTARKLTILWGALAIVMGLMFMEIDYALIVWGKIMGIATNGVLGLMALAFLPYRIHKSAALAGFAVAYAGLFMMMAVGVNFLLWPVVGNTVCFLVAIFLHPLCTRGTPSERASANE